MNLKKRFCCPVNGWDCPYFDQWKFCKLVDEGENPVLECDDAALFWEPDEDCFVWEDENGNLLDTQDLLMRGYHFVNGEPVKPPEQTFFGYEKWSQAIQALLAE